MSTSFTAVLIIPTGIGAHIGGYAGDALPVARAIATVVDCLITHPNVVNGANLYWSDPKIQYVEGYALDQFARGHWRLRPSHGNRIGVILDCDIPDDLYLRHLQVIAGAQATLGLDILPTLRTPQGLGVKLHLSPQGASWGTIAEPEVLLASARKLMDQGAEAIAVVSWFPDYFYDQLYGAQVEQYRQGQGVDILAGVEAVISHLVTRELHIPCAHAPALTPLPLKADIAPRAVAEELGYTFLPCVLVGLHRAPQLITDGNGSPQTNDLTADMVNVVIAPHSACGGSGLLSFIANPQVRLITVKQNQTALRVTPESLGIPPDRVISVDNYLEAIGVIAALKSGIHWRSLTI